MMTPFLLLAGLVDTVGFWAIVIILIAGIVFCVGIALRKFNVQIPDWVQQVFWALVVCFILVMAIGFLVSLAGGQPTLWLRGR